MSSVFYSNKEEIRNRMVKRAQELWGMERAADFDPLVVLMVEALSTELFSISNDVKNLDNRIFDKFTRVLASDNLVAPKPAHTVIHLEPTEDFKIFRQEESLLYKKKLQSIVGQPADQFLQLEFSPFQDTTLFHGKLKYMITPNHFYEVQGNHKKSMGRVQNNANNQIWLGINSKESNLVNAFKGLNFFFTWGNYQVTRDKYEILALTKWRINGQPVAIHKDRFFATQPIHHGIFQQKQFMLQLQKDVSAMYSDRFLTLGDDLLDTIFHPDQKLDVNHLGLPSSVDGQIDSNIQWIQIEFPAAILPTDLDELLIQINAIPVINKRLYQSKNRLKVLQNVVPVRTEPLEQMLTVHRIMDKDGVDYSEVPFENQELKNGVGYYTVRTGGVERVDQRSAKDFVDYLFELLRDEKAAFSMYNADFLSNVLQDIDKNITLIHQKSKVKAADIKEQMNYIILKPKNENDLVFAEVWLTYAEIGNGIGMGEIMVSSRSTAINQSPIVLLSPSQGGRNRLSRTESVQAFKYGLITADKVVTKNDIINFMQYELGAKLKRLEIKPGFMVSNAVNAGLIKTIDIVIEPVDNSQLNETEWQAWLTQLEYKLKIRSTMEQNYRVLLHSNFS